MGQASRHSNSFFQTSQVRGEASHNLNRYIWRISKILIIAALGTPQLPASGRLNAARAVLVSGGAHTADMFGCVLVLRGLVTSLDWVSVSLSCVIPGIYKK